MCDCESIMLSGSHNVFKGSNSITMDTVCQWKSIFLYILSHDVLELLTYLF